MQNSKLSLVPSYRAAGLMLLLALGFAGGAAAQTWTNNANLATATWSGTNNWLNGTAPAAGGGATVALTFGGFATGATAYSSTNNLAGTFFLDSLAITNGTLTLQGNPLLFTNNGATMPVLTNNSGYAAIISNSVTFVTNATVGGSSSIAFSGTLTNGAGTVVYNNAGGSAGVVALNGGTMDLQQDLILSGVFNIVGTGGIITNSTGGRLLLGSATGTILPSGSGTITIYAQMTNASGVSAAFETYGGSASSAVILRGANTFSGISQLGSGPVQIGINSVGSVGNITSSALGVGTVQFGAGANAGLLSSDSTTPRTIYNPLQWTSSGAASMTLGNAVNNGKLTFAGNMALGGFTRPITCSSDAEFDGVISGAGMGITKSGSGTLTLGGNNIYTGPTTISGGTLLLTGSLSNSPVTVSSGTLQLNSGTLTNSPVTVNSGGTLLVANGNTGSLTNSTVTVFGGGTNLVNGTLNLYGTSSVQVNGGFLGGSNGVIAGPVVVNAGGILSPSFGVVGSNTLNLSSTLTLTNGGIVNFALSTNTGAALTNDNVHITGSLILNGTNYVTLSFPQGAAPAGTNTLMTYSNTNGSAGTLALIGSYPNASLLVTSTNVQLVVTNGFTTYATTWLGQTNGVWDTITGNWTNGANGGVYYTAGDDVTFDDTAAKFIITNGTVSPGSVTFNNSAKNYTNAASIGGSGGLIKTGTGTTVLVGTNSYTGPTIVDAGTLQIGTNGSAGSLGSGPVTDYGALTFNLTNSYTLSNNVTGTGTINQSGTGALILTGTNNVGNLTEGAGQTIQVAGGYSQQTAALLTAANNCSLVINGGTLVAPDSRNNYITNLTISSGMLQIGNSASSGSRFDFATKTANSTLTISGGTLLVTNCQYGIRMNGDNGPGAAGINGLTVIQTGGNLLAPTGGALAVTPLQMGDTTGTANATNVYDLQGGVVNLGSYGGNSLQLGADTTNMTTTEFIIDTNGLLQCSANISGSQGTGARQFLIFNGGTLQAVGSFTVGPSLTNYVQKLGAVIDTTTNTVTISTPLVQDPNSTGGGLTKLGAGTLIISSTNTYTGSTIISNGAVSINNSSALGTGLITLAGGTLSNTLSSTLTNAVNLSGNATVSVLLTNTLTLGGIITNTGTLTVTGPGVLLVTNVNTYTNTTFVTGGTLGGSGTIAGPVNVAAATLAPGGVNAVGTLTLGTNLTIAAASVLTFDIASPSSYDTIAVGGTNIVNGLGIIQLNPLTGTITNGTYTLMTYASRSGIYVFPNGSTNLGNLTLTNGPTSLTLGTGGGNVGFTNLVWRGTNSIWDKAITYNWLNAGTATTYQDGNNVTFDDTPGANQTVAGTNLQPGSVVFNNNLYTYTISASTNTIAGTTAVTKLGTNTVTFSGTNLFSGGLNILNGTVVGSLTNSFGTGTITLGDSAGTNNATLFGGFNTVTATNNVIVAAGSSGNLLTLADNGGASPIFGGTVTLNHDLNLVSSGYHYLILNNVISGSGNLIVPTNNTSFSLAGGNGVAGVQLQTTNSYTGNTYVRGGQLSLNNTNCIGYGSLYIGDPTPGNTNAAAVAYGGNGVNNTYAFTNAIYVNAGSSAILQLQVLNNYGVFTAPLTLSNNLTLSQGQQYVGKSITFSNQVIEAVSTPLYLANGPTYTGPFLADGATNFINVTFAGGIQVGSGGLTLMNTTGTNGVYGAGVPNSIICANGYGYVTNSGGITGTGALTLQNNVTNSPGIVFVGAPINNIGWVTNSGGGTNTVLISAAISNNVLGLVQNAAWSQLILTGSNSYNGPTLINAGTLFVNGTNVVTSGTGTFTVASGGVLGGTGKIDLSAVNQNVIVQNGGKLSPGAASYTAGTNTFALGSGTLDLSAAAGTAGTLVFDFGPPGTSDKIVVSSGSVNIGSGLLNLASFAFNLTNGITPNTTYILIQSTNLIGSLASSGLTTNWGSQSITLATNGNNVVLTTATVAGQTATNVTWNGLVSGVWDSLTTNWVATGTTTPNLYYADTEAVTFDDTAVGNFTITGGTVSPSSIIVTNNANAYTISAAIAGTGSLMKYGTNTLTLSGANSFSGGLALKAGTVSFSTATGLGTGSVTLGDATVGAAATLLLTGAVTATNSITVAAGAGMRILATTANSTYSGSVTLNTNVILQVTGSSSPTLSGTFTGSGSMIVSNTGSAIDYFTGASSPNWTGALIIYAGQLRPGGTCQVNTNTVLSISSANSATFNFGSVLNGNLNFAGLNDIPGATGGPIGGGSGNSDWVTLNGSGNYIFSGTYNTAVGGLTIQMAPGGSQTLTGISTYSKSTIINSGTLLVNGAIASATTVNAKGILGGNGTISNSVTVVTDGYLAPGNGMNLGLLTVTTNVFFNGGAYLTIAMSNALTAGTTYSQLVINGTNTVTGTNYVQLSALTGTLTNGTYVLITNANYATKAINNGLFMFPGNTTNITIGGVTLTLTNSANSLLLAVPNNVTFTFTNLTWNGSVSSVWDTTTPNWFNAQIYADGDPVTFDDSAVNYNVTSGGTLNPYSVTFSNSVNSYTVGAAIGGATAVTKNGTATVTLTGTNTNTGGFILNAGTLALANGGVINNSSPTFNGGALLVTNGGAINLPAGTLNILTGTNTLAGGSITVQTLLATNNTVTTTNSTLNLTGGTLTTSNNGGYAASIIVSSNTGFNIGSSWTMNAGTNFINTPNGGTNNTYSVNIANATGATVAVNSNAVFNLGTAPTNAYSLTVGNTGTNNTLLVNGGLVTNVFGFQIGNNATGLNNQVIVTNGGQMYIGVNVSSTDYIGGNGSTNSSLVVMGSNGNQKSIFDQGSYRFYIGNTYACLNSLVLVGQGGVIQNVNSVSAFGRNGALIITNGGSFSFSGVGGFSWGRGGVSNTIVVAGADPATGSPALLSMTNASLSLGNGGTLGSVYGNSKYNSLWVGQGGLVTNYTTSAAQNLIIGGSSSAGDTNDIGNFLMITNGGRYVMTGTAVTVILGYQTNDNNNYVYVGGAFGGNSSSNALWDLGGRNIQVGGGQVSAYAASNTVTVATGGVVTNVGTLTVGIDATDTNNGVIVNGGTLYATNVVVNTNNYLTLANNGNLNGSVTVNGGTYGGTGTNIGPVNVTATGALIPGGVGAVGNLTITTNLTLNGGSPLTFNIASPGNNSQIFVSGTNVVVTNTALQLVTTTGVLTNGTYTLMTYTKGWSGSNIVFAATGTTNWTVNGVTLTLTNSATGLTLGMSGSGNVVLGNLTWKGYSSSVWDIATTTNWFNTGLSLTTAYLDGDFVTFDDTALQTTVTGGTVQPASVTFNNNASNYVVSATIGGTTAVTLNGTKALALSATNTYSGGTVVNAGTLVIASTANAVGTGLLTMNGGALSNSVSSLLTNTISFVAYTTATTVSVAGGQTLNLRGAITNTVGLTKSGPGQLIISGPATNVAATTNITVNGGELDFNNAATWLTNSISVGGGTLGITNGVYTASSGSYAGACMYVGTASGPGIVNQAGGSVTNASASIGMELGTGGGSGTYNLSGGNLVLAVSNPRLAIGASSGTSNTFNMSGGYLGVLSQDLEVGMTAAGAPSKTTNTFNQTGGTARVSNLTIGGVSGTNVTATFNLTGGSFTDTGATAIFNAMTNSVATINLGGSAQVILPALNVNSASVNASNTIIFDFTNGWLSPNASYANYISGFTNAWLTTNGANFNVGLATNLTVAQNFTNYPAQAGVLTKSGAGVLTLSGTNTYSGATVISAGTLALTNAALLPNTASIVVASNAIFNVSGLSSAFTLAQSLSSQMLSNSAPGAIINGTNNTGSGTVSLVYDGVNPAFTITNGGMTLSGSTTFKVYKPGAVLPPGVYRIIAKATGGTAGLVVGTVPAVTVNNGASSATLGIYNGELYLTNGTPSAITYTGTTFVYNGLAQSPSISFSGSTSAQTTLYVGTSVSYNSVNAPTNAGSYYVSNTVAADANYFGATNSQAFTISQAGAGYTAGVSLVSSSPTNGYLSGVNFTSTVPAFVNSGSVVFLTTNGAFSTNAISGGIAASLVITNLPRGTNVITAQYAGDANVAGWTNSILQYVTNHPPVAAMMTVVGTQGVDLAIALSDVATNWTDADGDPISLTGVTLTTTNGVVLSASNWVYQTNGTLVSIVTTNSWSYLFYPGGPSVADQISYSINDGQGGTNIGYINIVVGGNPVVGTNSIASYDFTNGVPFTLTAYGVIGQTYITQRSTNLTSWVPIATNTVDTNGVINVSDSFLDFGGVPPSPLFYRLMWQAP